MPIRYARRLTGRKRTVLANRHLGYALAFVAGAINAGGFLAVQQYLAYDRDRLGHGRPYRPGCL
jgi:hypothetical protein